VLYDGSIDALVYLHYIDDEAHRAHDVRIGVDGPNVRLTDALAPIRRDPGTPCAPDGPNAVSCPAALVDLVFVRLGDLADTFVNDTALVAYACGEGGNDTLAGGSVRDLLFGGAGRDEVFGRDGSDLLAVSDPDQCPAGDRLSDGEVLDGGAGHDQIHGGPAADVLEGGAGDDSLRGYAGDDRLAGGSGFDDLGGFAGADVLDGGDDRDLLFGGDGDDRLEGGAGDDTLGITATVDADGPTGTRAVATLVENGDDVLDGGVGDDLLVAGPGERALDFEDPLSPERRGRFDRSLQSAMLNGADVLRGGPGEDEASYFNRALPVRVTPDGLADDGSPGERDRVDADVEVVSGGAGDDVLTARPEGSTLFGDLGADRLAGDSGKDRLFGGGTDASADTLLGAGGDDELGGGGGDDRLDGGPGRDLLTGDDGQDLLRGEGGDDTLAGGTGDDRLEGGPGADCLHGFLPGAAPSGCLAPPPEVVANGADGDDVLAGGPGADRLDGGGGEDVADYSDAAGPVLAALAGVDPGAAARERAWADRDAIAADVEAARGGPRGDTLLGNAADNLLDGGPGDDHLDGGAGSDRLRGGPGRDLLLARDAGLDELRCGTARDLAVIDADDDLVALRADVCELIDVGQGSRSRTRVLGSPACPARLRLRGMGRSFRVPAATAVPFGTRILREPCGTTVQPPGVREANAARVEGGSFSVERGALALRGGAHDACRRGSRAELRRLSVTAVAPLRVDGRRGSARGGNAAWTIVDRCDATRVSVSRGRVRLLGQAKRMP
jgi:Ca2+-binding RTX toxin-like protein